MIYFQKDAIHELIEVPLTLALPKKLALEDKMQVW